MQANPRTLDALFNSQLRYVVPMFQRLYVWQESPQWETLWEDVAEKAELQLKGIKSNPHYLGALIIEGVRPASPREVKRFLVIDGQQRMTTLQLMLCAFRDIARKKDWKSLDRPLSRYLENSDTDVMERPDEEVYKLWPTTLNRSVFQSIVSAGSHAEISIRHPLVHLPRKRKPEPRSNLVEAYLYFSTRIESWIDEAAADSAKAAEEVAFALLQALQQDFCVVEIALSEGDDSQEIFYSLNSQGRALSQSDLLRSLIFMRAEKEGIDRDLIFDKYWSKFETDFWSFEVKRAGRPFSRLDLGLRYFLIAKSGLQVDARRVNEEYRRWVSQSPPRYPTVKDELADFSRHGDVYQRYESAVPSTLRSDDFRRVLIDFDVSTALPLVMFLELEAGLDAAQLAECLKFVESFIARRAVVGEDNKEYNKLFVDVVASLIGLKGDNVLPALLRKLLGGGGMTREWPSDGKLVESAISRPLYGDLKAPALRQILERLELALRGKKTEHGEISQDLQIEHVLPKSWSTHWPIKGTVISAMAAMYPHAATGELATFVEPIRARNRAVNTLGNLTLLNKYLNPAASHGSFADKLIEYRHSILRLNRYFDSATEWDEASITARGKELGEALTKIWPRPESPSA